VRFPAPPPLFGEIKMIVSKEIPADPVRYVGTQYASNEPKVLREIFIDTDGKFWSFESFKEERAWCEINFIDGWKTLMKETVLEPNPNLTYIQNKWEVETLYS
jgi:hypothetical protein